MVKKVLFLSLLTLALSAQHKHSHSHPHHFEGETTAAPMLDHRVSNWSGDNAEELALNLLSQNNWEAEEYKSIRSVAGLHKHYYLILDGHKLSFQGLSIHEFDNGDLWIQYPDIPQQVGHFEPLEIDTTNLRLELNCNRMQSEPAFLAVENVLLPGFSLDFYGPEGAHYQGFVSGNEVFNLADNRRYASDSTCTAMIFLPDPLSTANVNYGGAYSDNNDADNTQLNSERFSRTFTATYDNGVFKLENADLKIDEFSLPNVPPVTSTTPVFNYTRSQDGFEDVNTFFHLSHFKKYIDSLGFTSIPGAQISIDVHALSNSDQSYYSPAEKRIYMGEGGVDDAEDADVIIHEYGHTLVSAAAANTNRISERAGMEEAICDYFAVSWSTRFSPNQANRVFNWDGHNSFWPGRMASSTKDYQTLSFNANIYQHTDLMASCLKEILDNTSHAVADAIILQALFTLQNNSTYRDFARMVINADNLLNGGANYQIIKTAFVRRNVLSADFSLEEVINDAGISLYNTIGFLKGEDLILESEDAELAAYQLLDIQGRVIEEGTLSGNHTHINPVLKSGLYFLSVQNKKGQETSFKLLK